MACDHMENVQCTAEGGQYITGGGVYTGVMGANNGAGRLGDWNAKLCCDGNSVSCLIIIYSTVGAIRAVQRGPSIFLLFEGRT